MRKKVVKNKKMTLRQYYKTKHWNQLNMFIIEEVFSKLEWNNDE